MSVPQTPNRREAALAARAAGDRALALALFSAAGDPWSRVDAAAELLALGREAEAETSAEALSRERPDFAPAWRMLGLIARARGDHEAALRHFRAAAARDRGDLWSAYDGAQALGALGRAQEADEALRALAGGTPLPHALRALAGAARARGDAEGALAAARVAADLLPTDPWFLLDHAEALAGLGRVGEAEDALGVLAARHPRFAGAPRALMRLAARRGDRPRQVDHARALAALDPDTGTLDLADALLDAGEPLEAETWAARHLVRHGAGTRPLRLLARAARALGDGERALAHMRAACRLQPGEASLRAERAADAQALALFDEAEAEARAALGLEPAHPTAFRILAHVLRARGRPAEALDLARALWAEGTGPAQAGFELAADLRAAGRSGEAGTVYEALAARPDVATDALVELALLDRRLRGVDAARARLDEALRRDGGHARALLCLGDLQRETGDAEAASDAYRRALAVRPGFGWAHMGLALLAEARGDGPAAEEALRAAAEADPGEAHFGIALAQRLAERGAFDAARALLLSVPPNSPRAAEAMLGLARLLRLEGDGPKALALLAETARRWPDRPDLFNEAAEDALRLGRPGEALALLEEAESHAPGHPALLEARARHALSRDELAVASDLFAQAAAADPGRLWPRLMQARLLAMAGEPDRALAGLDDLAARFGERPEITTAAAELLRQLGRIDEAERRFDAALAVERLPAVAIAAALSAIECARLSRADALLSSLPVATRADEARLRFARAQLASARWDFDTAIAEGEAAVRLQPADGWYRNRLAHAALLALDIPRTRRVLAEAAKIEAGANALRGKSANPSQSHYGQLLDEFRLDADALQALRAALAHPSAERAGAIAACVDAFPDYTGAAILHFIEARREGTLARTLGTGGGGVPHVIHQFWTDDEVPADVAAYMASWRERNPGFRHRVWSEGEAREYLAAHAAREVSAAFARAREPAMKADLFRLALLSREGGVWADADDRCLRPIESLLQRGAGFVAYQEDLGSLGNNWLAARPDHPLLARALAEGTAAVNRGDGDILWLATGPGLLTRTLAHARCAASGEADDCLVLDRSEFLGFVAIHCLAAYKTSERHWSRTAFGGGIRRNTGRAA